MAGCIFCDIIQGQASAKVVHEDDRVVALLTTGPVNPGHTLVVPREHKALLWDLDEETTGHMFRVGRRIARALRKSSLTCHSVNLFMADGEVAFGESTHVHLHVFPRFPGDPLRIEGHWQFRPVRAELDSVAAELRGTLEQLR